MFLYNNVTAWLSLILMAIREGKEDFVAPLQQSLHLGSMERKKKGKYLKTETSFKASFDLTFVRLLALC